MNTGKFIYASILGLILFASDYCLADASNGIVGFWKTINESTQKPECIVAIYQYGKEYYGRIIVTYNDDGSVQDTIYQPRKRAVGIVGNPYYAGLDIIWGLKAGNNKYINGSIVDPLKGNIYGAEAWRQGNSLIVKGKLFIFWRNQTWPVATDTDFPSDFQKPDLTALVPVIPKTI